MIPADTEPGDIFTDAGGKLWRVQSICHHPTVTLEEVEGTLHDPNKPVQFEIVTGIGLVSGQGGAAKIIKRTLSGAFAAMMWTGFSRIWQCPQQKDTSA